MHYTPAGAEQRPASPVMCNIQILWQLTHYSLYRVPVRSQDRHVCWMTSTSSAHGRLQPDTLSQHLRLLRRSCV